MMLFKVVVRLVHWILKIPKLNSVQFEFLNDFVIKECYSVVLRCQTLCTINLKGLMRRFDYWECGLVSPSEILSKV